MPTKKELLTSPIQHIDIKQYNVVPMVYAMQSMAYSSRDLSRAASIYERMLRDQECGVVLCLAGSLIPDRRRAATAVARARNISRGGWCSKRIILSMPLSFSRDR